MNSKIANTPSLPAFRLCAWPRNALNVPLGRQN